MLKLVTLQNDTGAAWHISMSLLPGNWFVGSKVWPSTGTPILLVRGLGPIQARRYLRYDEARRVAAVQSRSAA